MFSRSASTVVASSARPEALRLLSAAQSSSRTFSSTALFRAENDSSSDPAARRAALENAAQGSSSTSPSNNNNNANPRGIRILRVPSNFGQNLRARSPAAAGAAASAGAGPGNAGPNGPLVRPPSSFKLMKNLQRMGGARLGGPGGGPRGPRGPRGANAGGNRKPQAGRRGAGAPRRRRKEENYGDEEDEYANLSESQTEALLAKIEAERPKPVRYNPQGEAKLATLAPTWPALPIGRSAEGGSSEGLGLRTVVRSTLDGLGGRMALGTEAPSDLGRRLLEGKMVNFRSEAEREEAIDAAKEIAREQYGDEELEDVNFKNVGGDARKEMLEKLVAGRYESKTKDATKSVPKDAPLPLINDVVRTLKNNESFNAQDLNSFVSLFTAALPKIKAKPKEA